jgi:uncharacterized protein YjbJ (UPF0337 family)
MGIYNEDEIKGKTKQVVGRVKDKTGEWTGDPVKEAEGEDQSNKGKAQESFGQARRKTGEKVKEIGERIAR